MTTTATAPSGDSATAPNTTTTNGSTYAPYVPHDLKYDTTFEDSLINAILNSEAKQTGIRIIPEDSDENATEGQSIKLSDIPPASLPHITEEDLPLPLTDPRRIYTSPLPGVHLTHPGGYLEGGPGLDPEMDTFPDDFLSSRPHITTSSQLHRALQKEINASVEMLKERLRSRQKARERNEQVEKELKTLRDQHGMELRIHNRMQEEVARKKEAKEKRRRERLGGGG